MHHGRDWCGLMDEQVSIKLDKLSALYLNTQAVLTNAIPRVPLTGRAQRQAQWIAGNAMGDLLQARKPLVGATLRLAYVRAMRASQPNARLDETQEQEVSALESQLQSQLAQIESHALSEFDRVLRHDTLTRIRLAMVRHDYQTVAAKQFVNALTMGVKPFTLADKSMEIVISTVNLASTAGTFATSPSGVDHV